MDATPRRSEGYMEALSEERAPTLPENPQNDSQEMGVLLVRYRQGDRTESVSVESHRERRSYGGQWAVMLVMPYKRQENDFQDAEGTSPPSGEVS